jgi:hypothetical protein
MTFLAEVPITRETPLTDLRSDRMILANCDILSLALRTFRSHRKVISSNQSENPQRNY